MVQEVFLGFVGSSRDFWEFCLLAPFDHPCPLKSGVSPLGKNSSLWGGTHLYRLYKGVTPRGKSPPTYQVFKRNTLTYINSKSVFNFAVTTTYRSMEMPWEQREPLVLQTQYKPTETFQYTKFYSCHPPGVKKGFIKGEALRLLRTYSSQTTRRKISKKFGKRLIERGYPAAIVRKYLSEVKFADRKQPLTTETNPPVKKKNYYLSLHKVNTTQGNLA